MIKKVKGGSHRQRAVVFDELANEFATDIIDAHRDKENR
jgi:hypothetical protein